MLLRLVTKFTIITTSLSFDGFRKIFSDQAMTNWLTHKSYVVNINGTFSRVKESSPLAKYTYAFKYIFLCQCF